MSSILYRELTDLHNGERGSVELYDAIGELLHREHNRFNEPTLIKALLAVKEDMDSRVDVGVEVYSKRLQHCIDDEGKRQISTHIKGPHPLIPPITEIMQPICPFCDGIIPIDTNKELCQCPAPQCQGCGVDIQGKPCLVRNVDMNDGETQSLAFCVNCTTLLADGKSIGVGSVDRMDEGEKPSKATGWVCSCGQENPIGRVSCTAQDCYVKRPYS